MMTVIAGVDPNTIPRGIVFELQDGICLVVADALYLHTFVPAEAFNQVGYMAVGSQRATGPGHADGAGGVRCGSDRHLQP